MKETINEIESSIFRCKCYLTLINLVDESVRSHYLHEISKELDGFLELMKEVIK